MQRDETSRRCERGRAGLSLQPSQPPKGRGTGVTFGPAGQQLAVMPHLFEEAEAAFRQEKFEEAKAICEDLLSICWNLPPARALISVIGSAQDMVRPLIPHMEVHAVESIACPRARTCRKPSRWLSAAASPLRPMPARPGC